MTLWKHDGFAHGSVATGTGGIYDSVQASPSIVTSPVRLGTHALRINAAGAATRVAYTLPTATRQVVESFYVYLEDLPGAVVQLATIANASGPGYFQFDSGTGRFAVSINNLGRTSVGPASVAADTWYLVDLIYDCSTGTASITARINGGAPVAVTRAQLAADASSVSLGTQSAQTFDCYYADWEISLDTADYPILDHWVESLIVTADGTHNIATLGDFDSFTGTNFDNATTTGYTFIDHRPLQLANTADAVIRQDTGTTTDYMEFLFENLTTTVGTVQAVRPYASAIESGGGTSVAEVRLLLSTNTEVSVIDPTTGNVSVIDATDDILATVNLFKRMANDPSGGWDISKVNGLKVRLGFGDAVPDVNFIDVMVEVAIKLATNATPTRVAAVAAVATPTIPLSATASPDRINRVVDIPTPTIRMTSTPTPTRIAAVAAVPMPFAIAGGSASANPLVVTARASLPSPTITATAPTTFEDFYSAGYGQGYESIVVEPPVVVPPPPPPQAPTPSLRVLIDFENDLSPLSGPMPIPVFTDVTEKLLALPVSVTRGRKRLMDRIETGQLSMTFKDVDRALDPSNQDSPYYPGVAPDRRIRLEAVIPWETDAFTMCSSYVGDDDIVGGGLTSHYISIFDGLTDEFTYNFPGPGKYATVDVRSSDVLALAARDEVSINTPYTYVWIAYESILDTRAYMGRDETTLDPNTQSRFRDIDQDTTIVAIHSALENMTAALDLVTASGGGNFYIGRDGRPTYRSRDALNEPVKMTFAVDAERYRDIRFSFDNALLINDVTVNGYSIGPFGTTETSIHDEDAASKQKHPGRPPLSLDTLLTDSGVMAERAREILANFAYATRYVASLEISQVSTDWFAVLSCDLWDKINLSVVLPNGDIIGQPSLIEGIDITTNNFREWSVTWWLSVPPSFQMLTVQDKSFENGSEGSWEAVTNCTIESTNQEWSIWHTGPNHIERQGYRPLAAPNGSYALWLKAAAAGEFFAHSGPYPVVGRALYQAEYKVRQARFLEDTTAIPGYGTTNGGPFRLDLEWYDENDVLLSTDLGAEVLSSFGWTQWVLVTQIKRAPTGAAFVRVRVGSTRTVQSGMFVDDGLLTRIVG